MAEPLFVAAGCLATFAIALGTILRRVARSTIVIDAVEAIGAAAAAVTIAAASASPLEIGCAAAIAFCAVTQQYAALVHAHIAKRVDDEFAGAPLGLGASCA